MTTLLQELEERQRKIATVIQLLKELGMADVAVPGGVSLFASTDKPSKFDDEARRKISEKMKAAWARKKADGKLMNPNQKPRKPIKA